MAKVELRNVSKSYGTQQVVHNISLLMEDGEFVVFVGPSGCGKSTLLRMIAGLEDISRGELVIGGTLSNKLTPKQRNVAMVFQSYALYPQMTVRENMAFSLSLERRPKQEIEEKVNAAAASLQLQDLLNRKPSQLSGGQRQRVAIGRAIVRNPRVFLLDEPLSNLDAALRADTRVELSELHQRLGTTMIYVTHDQVEAMTMADKIVVLNAGRVEQVGTPMELYRQPASRFVASFIGSPKMNIFEGQQARRFGAYSIGVRPEHMRRSEEPAAWRGTVSLVEHLGTNIIAHVRVPEIGTVTASLDGESDVQVGQPIGLLPERGRMHFFDAEGRPTTARQDAEAV
jgi:ABC-type sugar transport system ATPase subunit